MLNANGNPILLPAPKGANAWKQGADTCVLDKSVGCKDDPTVPRELEGYVSRIVPITSSDATTEQIIQSVFPGLVANGLLAVSEKQCIPKFDRDRNLRSTVYTKGPCGKVLRNYTTAGKQLFGSTVQGEVEKNLINLITKKYDMSFDEYRRTQPTTDWKLRFDMLRGAMNAAVALVPDPDPLNPNAPLSWIIHGDLHTGNILLNMNGGPDGGPYTAIADWGRALLLEDVTDEETFLRDINAYPILFSDLLESEVEGFKQHPHFVIEKLYRFQSNPNDQTYVDAIDVLRVWNVAAIVNSIGINPETFGGFNGLNYVYSQADLIEKINEQLIKWFGKEYATYIDLPGYAFHQYVPPQNSHRQPDPTPPGVNFSSINWSSMPMPRGVGGKRTYKKTKKALKKRNKRTRRR